MSGGGVVLVSSSIVRPVNSSQSGRTKIHLTPFDLSLLQFDYPQRGLLFSKPDSDFHLIISRLKDSLSLALEIYFPFAGRLVKTENLEDDTVSFFIDCDGSGARFLHTEAKSVSVSDILQPDGSVPDFLKYFFPADDFKSCDGVSLPLLVIQVTEMKDGVFISFCYNHMVADGVSMWSFFDTWSKICSTGSCFNYKPLVLKGWFLEGIDYPIHVPVSEAERSPPSREPSSVPITKEWIFHFTKKNISDLKAKANSEFASSSDLEVSSLQAVSAHMWRSIIRHSGVSREQKTHCRLVVDLRQRVNPPLEKDCFGNMVYLSSAITTVEELLDRGLGEAALQIRKLVSSQTNETCKSFAEDWVRNIKNLNSGIGSKVGNTIVIASSPRFEVYNKDFGWGKPIAIRAGPSNSINGKLSVFQGISEGSIDVQAILWGDVIVKLLADLEFLEHVTIA